MKYNTEIRNEDSLPIPYVSRYPGDRLVVDSLYVDHPLFLNVKWITTETNHLHLHCVGDKDTGYCITFRAQPGLLIKHIEEPAK